MSDVQKGPLMTYEEIVEALRLADRLGDCVPENIEGTARAIVAGQTPSYHVVVYDTDGTALDPCAPPVPRRPHP